MDIKQAIKQLDIEVKAPLLTGKDFWTTKDCPEIGLDSVQLSDGPHGMRVQETRPNHLGMGSSRPATCFPTASAMACSWDEQLCFAMAKRLGEEAAYQGISMVLGPGLNLKRNPLCGRNFEYFSEDGYLAGKIAAAYVRGIQSTGVFSCVKHFAVNSRELGRMVYDCAIDEGTLRESYLTAFEIAVKEGKSGGVMTAYNKVNGVYCNDNPYLIKGILRGEWKYNGLVVSDWGAGRDAVGAIKAGSDLEMPRCEISAPQIINAVRSGKLDEHLVDESVERIYNFYDKSRHIERPQFNEEEHSSFAQKCAEGSMALLKNEGGALPLKKGERVAVIGDFAKVPRYQGAGSSLVNATSIDNILGAIEKSDLTFCGYAQGFHRFGKEDKRLISAAKKLGTTADTLIVCLGLDENDECEGSDRLDILLPQNQVKLLSELATLNKKIVVVLSCGSVVDTSWDRFADGLLLAHLSGQSGGGAVVNILTGKVNPSGHLAETYIKNLADCACGDIYMSDPYKMVFAEGIYVGYKFYNTFDIPVKYPFGYGLSYTKFDYFDFAVTAKGATFKVQNSGEMAGCTVAQIYIKNPRANLKHSPRELKAFKKVYLEKGQTKEVVVPFDNYSFRRWAHSRWEVGGEYEVCLGENSRDILFTQKLIIGEGDVTLPKGYFYCSDQQDEQLEYDEYYNRNAQVLGGTDDKTQQEKSKKRRRIIVDYTTLAQDLKYSKGIFGRVFGFIVGRYSKSKDKLLSSAMSYLPLRSLMQFLKLTTVQAEGFLEACNGHFFKGVKKLIFKK